MKKILIAFVSIFYIFSIPVFASDEDILKEPIKEVEEIEDGENLFKGSGNINNTRATTTDATLAKRISFDFMGLSQYATGVVVNVDNIPLGEKYYIEVTNQNNTYYGAIAPYNSYFIRGQEVPRSNYGSFYNYILNDTVYSDKMYVSTMYDNTSSNPSGVAIIYTEPEPTPEPTPTPEPEEPEVDPETISGNEILREILITNREINENVKGIYQYISNNSVSDSVLSDNSVSDNIIYKRLEDYSTSESLALIGLVLAFGALVIYLIHKTVFKIRR